MKIKKIKIENVILNKIGNIADRDNISVYVVGGYVRDLLLERKKENEEQFQDIDIVIIGDGIKFAEKISDELHASNLVVYKTFGTAMLNITNQKIEFVGARKESYNKTSRKPSVEDGSLEDDLKRRDFTINAMAVNLNSKNMGDLVDPFKGLKDLEKRIIRTPLDPAKTFDDDPLRIMRAVRFATQLEFDIHKDVLDAAAKMVDRLSIVSQERITEEFLKIMNSAKPSIGLQLMNDIGIMKIVLPEIANLSGVEQREDYQHKDVFRHTLQVVDNIAQVSNNLWLRISALFHDIGKPKTKAFKQDAGWTFYGHDDYGARMIKNIFKRMRLPFEHIPYVEKLIRLHLRPQALVDDNVTDSAVRRLMFETGNDIDDLITLCKADITSKNQKLVKQVLSNYERLIKKIAEVEERDRIRNWQPPLRGDEIMKICNIQEGKMVGILKDEITEAILEGKIPNEHDAAVNYLLSVKDELMKNPPKKKKKCINMKQHLK